MLLCVHGTKFQFFYHFLRGGKLSSRRHKKKSLFFLRTKKFPVQSQMKRRSLALEDVEGLELDPNLEEPLKAKARRDNSQDKGLQIFYTFSVDFFI